VRSQRKYSHQVSSLFLPVSILLSVPESLYKPVKRNSHQTNLQIYWIGKSAGLRLVFLTWNPCWSWAACSSMDNNMLSSFHPVGKSFNFLWNLLWSIWNLIENYINSSDFVKKLKEYTVVVVTQKTDSNTVSPLEDLVFLCSSKGTVRQHSCTTLSKISPPTLFFSKIRLMGCVPVCVHVKLNSSVNKLVHGMKEILRLTELRESYTNQILITIIVINCN